MTKKLSETLLNSTHLNAHIPPGARFPISIAWGGTKGALKAPASIRAWAWQWSWQHHHHHHQTPRKSRLTIGIEREPPWTAVFLLISARLVTIATTSTDGHLVSPPPQSSLLPFSTYHWQSTCYYWLRRNSIKIRLSVRSLAIPIAHAKT